MGIKLREVQNSACLVHIGPMFPLISSLFLLLLFAIHKEKAITKRLYGEGGQKVKEYSSGQKPSQAFLFFSLKISTGEYVPKYKLYKPHSGGKCKVIKIHTELSKCLLCITLCQGPRDRMSRTGKNSMLRGQIKWLGILLCQDWEEFLKGLQGFPQEITMLELHLEKPCAHSLLTPPPSLFTDKYYTEFEPFLP